MGLACQALPRALGPTRRTLWGDNEDLQAGLTAILVDQAVPKAGLCKPQQGVCRVRAKHGFHVIHADSLPARRGHTGC